MYKNTLWEMGLMTIALCTYLSSQRKIQNFGRKDSPHSFNEPNFNPLAPVVSEEIAVTEVQTIFIQEP